MMDFLNFTFGSFWHFVGVWILLDVVANGIGRAVRRVK